MTPRLVRILVALGATALVSALALGGPPLGAQSPTAKLEGHVRDSLGRALPAAHVILLGTAYEAVADSTGYYFINSIPAGQYNIEAHANGQKGVRVMGLRLRSSHTTTQDFKMTPATRPASGATLQGFVRDSAGRPVPHARVVVVGTAFLGTADAVGCYRIGGLPPGTAIVRGSFVGYSPVEVRDVVLSSEATTRLDLRLNEKAVTLSVSSNAFDTSIDTRLPVPEFGSAGRPVPIDCP